MGVKAVHFDEFTYLRNDDLSSVMPLSTNSFFLSYWYNSGGVTPGTNNIVIANDRFLGSGIDPLFIQQYTSPSAPPATLDVYMKIYYQDIHISNTDVHFSAIVPWDGNWHHVMLSFPSIVDSVDNSGVITSEAYYAIDNIVSSFDNMNSIPNGDFVTQTLPLGEAVAWAVGYGGNSGFDLAELFLLAGTSIDITDPDVRAKFIDPDTLLPVPIDAGGLWPFFDSLGVVPQIWLSGNQDLFPRNYPGWTATCVSQTDSDPTSQFTVVGNLTTAGSDPFGQSGVGV